MGVNPLTDPIYFTSRAETMDEIAAQNKKDSVCNCNFLLKILPFPQLVAEAAK